MFEYLKTELNEYHQVVGAPVETDEMVTKAPLAEEDISTEAVEENVSTEASGEEQKPVDSDESVKAPVAAEETTVATETIKTEEALTKAPLAGGITELPLGAEEDQDEIVTKATVEPTEEDELSTEASGEENKSRRASRNKYWNGFFL